MQFLTGQECFNEYLNFIVGWWRERRNFEVELDMDITPEGMVDAILQSKSKWDEVVSFITVVMGKKEADERKMQAAGRPE